MTISLSRRNAILGAAALGFSTCLRAEDAPDCPAQLAALEAEAGGRLGAYVLDVQTGKGFGWREDELFGHCSSFKLSLAAMALRLHQLGGLSLDEEVDLSQVELEFGNGELAERAPGTMQLGEIARAALMSSDNNAANLLLRRFGGPEGMTQFWRSIGDEVSRLDRYELELNHVPDGEVRDTTSPRAMAHTVAKLVAGDVLIEPLRNILAGWMADVKTGRNRIRAGLPKGWPAGDKTGTGIGDDFANYVDLAWVIPPSERMMVIAGYYRPSTPGDGIDPAAEAVLAKLGGIAAEWVRA